MRTYKMKSAVLALLSVVLFMGLMTSCRTTARNYAESGNPDRAIVRAVEKLRGKKKKNTEWVKTLESTFERAQTRDLARIDRLTADTEKTNWSEVNALHRDIRDRQALVAPLLPLVAKNGYRPYFRMVSIEQMEEVSRKKAAEMLYTRAETKLIAARNGDKKAARSAFDDLEFIRTRYYGTYANMNGLKAEARKLGTNYVLFSVRNKSTSILPIDFEDRIMDLSKRELDAEWLDFSLEPVAGITYDYRAFFDVHTIQVSPERITERAYTDTKDIEDGFDYVLDKRGNVRKDSLGNDMKIARRAIVRADILEVYQTKAAKLEGTVLVFQTGSSTPLDRREIGAEVFFEHYASTFRGDRRALSDESCARIGNQPVPFPSDVAMLMDAADRLKGDVRGALRSSRSIF